MGAAAAEDLNEPKPTIFGLTGGIATGKSFVSRVIQKHCIPVVDADWCAREVVKPTLPCLPKLVEAFGEEILQANKLLDRAKLGALVFGNVAQLNKLNSIIQPFIVEEANYMFRLHLKFGCRVICYDAALIVEMGLADTFRPLVVVSCKPETQLARLLERGLTEEQARARIASQLSTEAKEAVADAIINTDGTKDETIEQVDALVSGLLSSE